MNIYEEWRTSGHAGLRRTVKVLAAVLAFGAVLVWLGMYTEPADQSAKADHIAPVEKEAETPVLPGTAIIPETPAEAETPVVAEKPIIPETPVAAEKAIIPETPAAAETPIMPDTPAEPDAPAAPAVPETPIVPDTPAEPDAPAAPAVPETPIVPDRPAEPDAPAAPETSIVPDTPAEPDAPAAPETPIVPDTPVEPDAPAVPDTSVTPEVPDESEDTTAPSGIIDGFLVDENGMIYGVADPELVVSRGLMQFPAEGCIGIRAGAFSDGLSSVREIWIPSNITQIEAGAFAGLTNVEWYTAEPGSGFSDNMGVLLSDNGTRIFAFPAGRTGSYLVPAEITGFAENAFADAVITALDLTECTAEAPSDLPGYIEVVKREAY